MPNAGLAAYPSWVPTMQLLLAPASPSALAQTPPGSEGPLATPDIQGSVGALEGPKGGTEEAAVSDSAPDMAGVCQGMTCVVTDYCEEALVKAQVG